MFLLTHTPGLRNISFRCANQKSKPQCRAVRSGWSPNQNAHDGPFHIRQKTLVTFPRPQSGLVASQRHQTHRQAQEVCLLRDTWGLFDATSVLSCALLMSGVSCRGSYLAPPRRGGWVHSLSQIVEVNQKSKRKRVAWPRAHKKLSYTA